MICSIAGALEAVGDRWGFLLLRDLMLGLTRYDEFQKSTGIPAQTLADRLRHLEHSGLIVRRRYQQRPPRDEYVFTAKGRDFWKVLTALREWGDRWDAHGGDGLPLAAIDRMTGHGVALVATDVQTGEPVPIDRIRARLGPGADELMAFRLSNGDAQKTRQ